MTLEGVERKLVAILAADIAGFSRLVGADEEGTLTRLKALRRELIDPTIAEHRGRIVKTTGDGMLVEFASVVDAVRCAVSVQGATTAREASLPQERRIDFRVGINLGDIVVDGDDILGDGVNIAARLEGIAEPGGICISGVVHDQVRGKLEAEFADLGEQSLRNISRPVRVYRVVLDKPASAAPTALPLPDKPSIAVMAFQNMSGDPEQEYFADGIAEDITTALSRSHQLFVIARNSSFTYKGQAVDVKRVGRELGVRYVLEGSLRKGGTRVRITAQLIETETGAHLWAERYDREPTDIFEVQDEITRNVAMAIEPALSQAERQRVMRKSPDSLDAWEAYHRGLSHYLKFETEENEHAKTFFQRAIDRDPGFSAGYYGLSLCYSWEGTWRFMRPQDECAAHALRLGQRAVGLDDGDAMAHIALAAAFRLLGDVDGVRLQADRALAINPNNAWALGLKGVYFAYSGHPREALAALETAMRASPHDPLTLDWMARIGVAHFFAREYEETVVATDHLIRLRPEIQQPYRFRAAALGQLGRLDEAKAALAAALEMDRGQFQARVSRRPPWMRPADHELLADGLRKAGWTGTVE